MNIEEQLHVNRRNIALLTLMLLIIFVIGANPISAQNNITPTTEDRSALEDVIVEKYYVSDTSDYSMKSLTGDVLPEGSVTYRIYIDMKPGYVLQLVYGNENHELSLNTTTRFFNNREVSAYTGYNVDPKRLNSNTVALDSWITMGAATRLSTGIMRIEDTVDQTFIVSRPTLSKADGLTKGIFPTFQQFNLDLNFFNNDSTASHFVTKNGGWAALEGVKGPTATNRVLIAQLTTNGKLSFELNVQIGTPTKGYVKYVAKNPQMGEILFDKLKFEQK